MKWGTWVVLAAAAWTSGCSDDTAPAPCPEGNTIGGVCAGVPLGPLCDADTCTTGTCSTVVTAGSDAELQSAVTAASAGMCIALKPGNYGAVELPDQVSLFGRGADFVTIAGVTVGVDGRLVGMTVTAQGVVVSGTGAVIDAVRTNGSGNSIHVSEDASASVSRASLMQSAMHGVYAVDAAAITVNATIVEGSAGPGIWAECAGGCACTAATPVVTLSNVIARDNARVGVSLIRSQASFTSVDVLNTTVDQNFYAGGGVSVSGCSDLTASALRVHDSDDFGILVDDSSITLTGVELHNNLRGIWLQNIGGSATQAATITDLVASGNRGVGLGMNAATGGVTINNADISDTSAFSLPVLVEGVSAGAEEVGDGLTWLAESKAVIDGLTLTNSARAALLIDGEVAAGSTIANIAFGGGDEAKGAFQQNFPMGGLAPQVDANSSLAQVPEEQFPVPDDVAIPPGI